MFGIETYYLHSHFKNLKFFQQGEGASMYLLWIVHIHHNNDIKVVRNSTVHNVTIIRSSQCSMKCCGAGAGAASALLSPAIVSGGAGRARVKGGQLLAECYAAWHVTRDTDHGRWAAVCRDRLLQVIIFSVTILHSSASLHPQKYLQRTPQSYSEKWLSMCGYHII